MRSKKHYFFGTALSVVSARTGKWTEICKNLVLDRHQVYVDDNDQIIVDGVNICNEKTTEEIVDAVRKHCNTTGE